MRVTDHHFTMPDAPVYGWEDPFFDSEGMTALESERCLPSECSTGARVGPAAGSRSSSGSGAFTEKEPTQ